MVTEIYNMGIQTSDVQDALKAGSTSISRLVDIRSVKKMEFIDAVNMRPSDTLDVHFFCQDDNQELGVYEIYEGADSPLSRMKSYDKIIHLKKYRAGVEVDDESKIRLDQSMQLMNQINQAGKSFANKRDYEILRTFLDSAGVSATVLDANRWNTSNADITGDVGDLIDALFNKDRVKVGEEELNRMIIYYPSKLYSQIRNPAKIFSGTSNQLVTRSQVNTSDMEFTQGTYGVSWVASHKLNYVGKAVVVIPGEETADHYTYTGGSVPEVETDRDIKEGTEYWINTRYFGTLVYPNDINNRTTNDRIMLINNVCAATTNS